MSAEIIVDCVLFLMLVGIGTYLLIDGLRRGRRRNGACSGAEVRMVPPAAATLAARRARQASAQRGWRTRRQAGNPKSHDLRSNIVEPVVGGPND